MVNILNTLYMRNSKNTPNILEILTIPITHLKLKLVIFGECFIKITIFSLVLLQVEFYF